MKILWGEIEFSKRLVNANDCTKAVFCPSALTFVHSHLTDVSIYHNGHYVDGFFKVFIISQLQKCRIWSLAKLRIHIPK
jgi:hypothetical protein